MTLDTLLTSIRSICLGYKNIQGFDYGEDYQLATGKGQEYPLAFLEIPYSSTYDLVNPKLKTIQFALCILLESGKGDNVLGDHVSISHAERWGDEILLYIQHHLKEFKLESVNGVSLREFSDDNAAGYRFEIQGKLQRTCLNEDNFIVEENG